MPNTLNEKIIDKIGSTKESLLPLIEKDVHIAPCIGQVGKIICIGLNYYDHALEIGIDPPSEPIIFMKATSAINGPNDNIVIPKNSKKTDWEAELGIIIGKEAKYINKDSAYNHILGYCIVNDISERDFQLEKGGQWVKGKSCDTFAPIGPYLVTKDEVTNPQNLKIWLELNGKKVQNSSTKEMSYKVDYLVSYLSQFMSLQPGDIISTGSPPGVGIGMKPNIFLKPGDTIHLGIEKLGTQRQKVVSESIKD